MKHAQGPSTAAPAEDGQRVELDAVVVGAGVAGLYQLHQLRRQGLRVRAFDSADDVGGTWCWNRYPGARFDSEAYIYQYLFSESLYKDWSWSRRFPDQGEVERWMHYVADTLDLRPHISLSTTVTSAHFDEDRGRWTVRTDRGDTVDTQFLVSCAGMLSAPLDDWFPGQETFHGPVVHTARWPREGVELRGRKVAVIGTGATGIQVVQTIADQVDRLTVFARTPQYVLPMKNPSYGPSEVAAYKDRFEELRGTLPETFTGFEYDFTHTWAECTPRQRRDILEEVYQDGSLKLWLAGFGETFFEADVNEEVSEFVREKMRERLRDERLIDLLVPGDYGFGERRVPLENGYLETYHRDNVELVGVADNPITRFVPEGIELADGSVHAVDVIIMAIGFDAGTGALTRIDLRGRDGRSLREEWGHDIRTTMGLAVHGYPNLLTAGAPLAPAAALCNMTTCLQQQTEWISDAIGHLRGTGASVIEPTAEAEQAWVDHHEETANAMLLTRTASWYMGANIPGKPRRMLSYTGGAGAYRRKCADVAAAGYPGFRIE
ncbi:flavin-containing monooxygenase [Streptomyces sp. SHP 1-2]|uniref:flavin-containing monooxygenase n=1 Tax=Streptomyces sp. SHP 1-2 TaxID=2769489 RepID=UPI00223727CB|nr:NAD(P)/FAD-dependent oxidoreductase [Streptomyces sp. SHP 1-2]MCW5252026.1 NAD(P)/FAD-dependent oxidoreductase [Streptomyces sp. SHP 1-2]